MLAFKSLHFSNIKYLFLLFFSSVQDSTYHKPNVPTSKNFAPVKVTVQTDTYLLCTVTWTLKLPNYVYHKLQTTAFNTATIYHATVEETSILVSNELNIRHPILLSVQSIILSLISPKVLLLYFR